MTDNNNIENLFKETFDKYEAPVDASVWKGVEEAVKNIPAPAAPVTVAVKSFSVVKSIIAFVSVATIAVVTYSVLKPKSPEAIKITPVANEIVAEKNNSIQENATFLNNQKNNSDAITVNSKSRTEKIREEASVAQQNLSITVPAEKISAQTAASSSAISLQEPVAPSVPLKVTADTHPLTENDQKQSDAPLAKTGEVEDPAKSNPTSNPLPCDEPSLTNTFTPNNDGINDVYFIDDTNLKEIQVRILDSRNKMIKQWDRKAGFWDGKLPNGNNAENGTYILIVNAVCNNGDPFKKKINIQLIRQ